MRFIPKEGGIVLPEINNDTQICSGEGVRAYCKCHGENRELARAYVPMQGFDELFKPEVGLRSGTIFPELFRPYTPRQRQS